MQFKICLTLDNFLQTPMSEKIHLNSFTTMKNEVNLEIYNLIEPLFRATFQNTEIGISIKVNHKRVNIYKILKITYRSLFIE